MRSVWSLPNFVIWLGVNASETGIDPCLPSQSLKADMGRNIFPLVSFFHDKGPFDLQSIFWMDPIFENIGLKGLMVM